MLDFYRIVKENLSFNRFEYRETVCLEYTCPIDAEDVGILSRNDYVVYVLSGKKTYKTLDGEWTLVPGQILYLKKGAEMIHQYFDDEYCMLGFFVSDELIRETYDEVKGQIPAPSDGTSDDFTAREVTASAFLAGYFDSMLNYFRGHGRPPDPIMLLKIKELLITLMDSDRAIAAYFGSMASDQKPSVRSIMEKNFCFNLKLEQYADLCHRSLSTFKREFQQQFDEAPGKWLRKRRVQHAVGLIENTGMTLSQIALESGFEDLSHFSRVFKDSMGVPPSAWRKTA